jgi:hypoxanthine-guanine phosphoribosyltransferase
MNVTLGDKEFRPYLSAADIDKSIEHLAERINADYAGKNPLVIGVLNGSFIFVQIWREN